MFNLTVDEAHTFYVGNNGWLVHNTRVACPNGGVDSVNGRRPINSDWAGKTMPIPTNLQQKYGVTGVQFNAQGYPDFSPFSLNTQTLPVGRRNHGSDFTDVNKMAGLTNKDLQQNKLVWHHHEDGVTMLLLPRDIHDYVKHTGGVATTK